MSQDVEQQVISKLKVTKKKPLLCKIKHKWMLIHIFVEDGMDFGQFRCKRCLEHKLKLLGPYDET